MIDKIYDIISFKKYNVNFEEEQKLLEKNVNTSGEEYLSKFLLEGALDLFGRIRL